MANSTSTRVLPFDRPDPMEPPPAYAELRESTPVAKVGNADGRPAWLVTSYDAAEAVLSDPRFGVTPPGEAGAEGTLLDDGPGHGRLRRLVGKAFTPRSVAALRPRIEEWAREHVAAMAASGPPADLVASLASPLPILVISDLLGVAIDERDLFRELADTASAADPFAMGVDGQVAEGTVEAWTALAGYAAGLVAAKRELMGDDLLSALIAVRDTQDGRLSDEELISLATTVVAAGYLTTRNAISVGAIRLVSEGRLAELAGDSEPAEQILEEVLRLQAGLTGEPFPRWAQQDLELSDTPIARGDLVLVRLEAASRDPRHFAEPDRLDPHRRGSDLTFGRGPHYCLGAALARVEVGAALRALAQRLPDLRIHGAVEDVPWIRSHTDAGPTILPVTWG
ncbi:cytochrome P450 [Actinopolymorpha pittospori]